MGKVINLAAFSVSVPVSLEGREYSVRIFTVGDYIDGDVSRQLARVRGGAIKGYFSIIAKRSDIPEDVIQRLKFTELERILLLMQGVSSKAEQRGDDELVDGDNGEVDFADVMATFMQHYPLSVADIREMPLPMFWSLFNKIPRLRATAALATIHNIHAAFYGNEEYVNSLVEAVDKKQDYSNDETFDKGALERFKRSVR